jgi:hypothetical protein
MEQTWARVARIGVVFGTPRRGRITPQAEPLQAPPLQALSNTNGTSRAQATVAGKEAVGDKYEV